MFIRDDVLRIFYIRIRLYAYYIYGYLNMLPLLSVSEVELQRSRKCSTEHAMRLKQRAKPQMRCPSSPCWNCQAEQAQARGYDTYIHISKQIHVCTYIYICICIGIEIVYIYIYIYNCNYIRIQTRSFTYTRRTCASHASGRLFPLQDSRPLFRLMEPVCTWLFSGSAAFRADMRVCGILRFMWSFGLLVLSTTSAALNYFLRYPKRHLAETLQGPE